MKVKLTEIKGSYEQVANRARTTVNKGELGKEPSDKFKRKILMILLQRHFKDNMKIK